MKKLKRTLCLLLALATVLSICAVGFTVQAVEVETAEVSTAYPKSADDFTWDNVSMYFLLTDRFYNGDTSNDHSYNRGKNQDGSIANINNVAAFQGGDFTGITKKIEEGYFDKLGVNAIWVSGFCEQIHGYVVGGDGKSSFPHYSYHGYYALDFTELDANYGTEAEFKKMIDTAHEHNIRIVLDVVMNHPGYNSIYDMNEYNFGTLYDGWQSVYYNFSNINQTNYHGKIGYQDNATNWGRWWGKDWIRAGLAGYDNNGGGDLTGAVTYLPDFKTESTQTVSIPTFLKTKWGSEYNAKVAEIDKTFKTYNLGNKTVTNYLVAWLTKWVEDYGVDGFRCDTAKHVDMSSWKALNTACTKALKNWRAANPSAPGADWDEDFWMTGENFGQGVSNNNYYSQGGFDSMINFSFSGDSQGNNCNGLPGASSINNTYSSYASQINTNDNFNVLTYISSHDTGLCRNDLYYQGSALLLLPGGVQIFYGDETNRQYVQCSIHDHESRSYMNWDKLNSSTSNESKILEHWQKVGTFRNNHVAVGAGSHSSISATSGTAFTRTYNKNGVTDKVACVIGASNNANVTVTVSSVFPNGTLVRNAYDGTTATVKDGKVAFNSGAHGTILIEVASSEPQPTVTKPVETKPVETKPTETTPSETKPTDVVVTEYVMLGDADLSEKVNVKDATLIQKAVAGLDKLSEKQEFAADVDGNKAINVKDATAIQKFVASMEVEYKIGEKVVYKQGTQPAPSAPTVPTTVSGGDVGTTNAMGGNTIDLTQIDGNILILNNSRYSSPNAYYWSDENIGMTAWPGEAMQEVAGFYYIVVPKDATWIIFNDGNGTQTDDIAITENFAIFDMDTNSWNGNLADVIDVTQFPLDGGDIITPSPNPSTPDPGEDDPVLIDENYIYVKDDAGWGTVYVHYWNDSAGSVWPGTQMESVGNNVYRYALDSQFVNIVFNNGNGTQTADLTAERGKTYSISSNAWN